MLKDAVNDTDRKIVNHSTRKHLIQKLVDSEIPRNEIIQITGHKNINSMNNYSTLSATTPSGISQGCSIQNVNINITHANSSSCNRGMFSRQNTSS